MFSKEKLSMVLAEFLGTAMLTSMVITVSHMFTSGTAAWYVALSAGTTLALIVAVFGHVSGAHVNPAVTIGMWTMKKIPTTNAVVYVASQMLGGATALLMYNYFTNSTLVNTGGAVFDSRVFFAEVVGSALFGMGIVAAVSQKLEGYWAAFAIGTSLTFGALVASVAGAGFLNPAVALGNNAWNRTFAIAPIVGMVIGMNVYMALIAPQEKVLVKVTKRKK